MRKRLLIFDFDGTLVDSMGIYARKAGELISEHYGLSKEEARELYLKTSGLPFAEQLEILFPGNGKNREVAETFERWKEKVLHDLKPFPEAEPLLRELKERGYLVAVSSNNLHMYVQESVKGWKVRPHFVLGWDGGEFKKGEPHVRFLEKATSLPRESFLIVGDSPNDLKLARSSGIDFVALLRGFPEESFRSVDPSVKVIKSLTPEELLPILEEGSHPLKDSNPVLPS